MILHREFYSSWTDSTIISNHAQTRESEFSTKKFINFPRSIEACGKIRSLLEWDENSFRIQWTYNMSTCFQNFNSPFPNDPCVDAYAYACVVPYAKLNNGKKDNNWSNFRYHSIWFFNERLNIPTFFLVFLFVLFFVIMFCVMLMMMLGIMLMIMPVL